MRQAKLDRKLERELAKPKQAPVVVWRDESETSWRAIQFFGVVNIVLFSGVWIYDEALFSKLGFGLLESSTGDSDKEK